MPIFSHRSPTPFSTTDYRRFRPYIREDFEHCCAYCLLPEQLAGGQENFELDHFRPRSRFAHLVSEYSNLYYACHVCNREKRDHWPCNGLQAQGYRFVDTCSDDFSSHFRYHNGEWQPLSPAGEYTAERIRLNRIHLVRQRRIITSLVDRFGTSPIDWDSPLFPQLAPLLDSVADLGVAEGNY